MSAPRFTPDEFSQNFDFESELKKLNIDERLSLPTINDLVAELQQATKVWATPERMFSALVFQLLVNGWLKGHGVGFFRRWIAVMLANELRCYVLYPEDYKATYAASRKFWRGLLKELS